jgi:hypothetical protein
LLAKRNWCFNYLSIALPANRLPTKMGRRNASRLLFEAGNRCYGHQLYQSVLANDAQREFKWA